MALRRRSAFMAGLIVRSNRNPIRDQLAREAARIMVESGIKDFQFAKRKACERLRMRSSRHLPGNEEIEQAIREYQRIFSPERQPMVLQRFREAARDAMQLLADFNPFLVGPVLTGTADENSEASLHLFAEPQEAVGSFLSERGIPHRLSDRRLRISRDEFRRLPTYRYVAGDVPIELVVFDINAPRNAPLSPVDGKPMARASLAQFESLMECQDAEPW